MSLFAVTIALLASSVAIAQTPDYQEIFQQAFTHDASEVQSEPALGINFVTSKRERAEFYNVRVSLKVLNAETIPHTTKILVRGVPREITTYSQRYTIKADAAAEFQGTLPSGKEVNSHVSVTDAYANLTLSITYNDLTRFSAYETEFDISKVVTVLVRGAPQNILTGSVTVSGLPDGSSAEVERIAASIFAQRIHETLSDAVDNTVKALNRL